MFIPVASEHHHIAFKETSQSEVPEMPTLDSMCSVYIHLLRFALLSPWICLQVEKNVWVLNEILGLQVFFLCCCYTNIFSSYLECNSPSRFEIKHLFYRKSLLIQDETQETTILIHINPIWPNTDLHSQDIVISYLTSVKHKRVEK